MNPNNMIDGNRLINMLSYIADELEKSKTNDVANGQILAYRHVIELVQGSVKEGDQP